MVQDFMMERLSTLSIPATLLFNKMDVTGTDELASLQQIGDKIKSLYPHIRNELYISALEEDGIEDVKVTSNQGNHSTKGQTLSSSSIFLSSRA
jgi:translation elongation factor EF-G